jgi:2-polyprenyl-6-methoxyphenol hydroxylase-like FAD-dependent oxidoreductase
VGLTTALSLARKDIPVTVLEAEPELVKEFRGSTLRGVHPGGMGPNGGIHDAVNLSEKLARVWQGTGDGTS